MSHFVCARADAEKATANAAAKHAMRFIEELRGAVPFGDRSYGGCPLRGQDSYDCRANLAKLPARVKIGEMSDGGLWQFWIDRGGTFTDVVAKKPDVSRPPHKLLPDTPEQYRDAAIAAIRQLLAVTPGAPIPVERIEAVKMGTTV